ncbi:MAG: O-antigen ligase family protein [Thermoleophilia bacterium]|nr:O-antigen ligase family protein [Thermoleophilia bacterium]
MAAVVAAPAAAWAVWTARRTAAVASGPALLTLGALTGLAAWSALSILWALAPDLAWIEVNRTLLVLAALAAALGIAARLPGAPSRFALGLALACAPALAWGLGSRIAPTLLAADGEPARLEAPLGYWNALALVAVMAVPGILWLAGRPGAGRWSVGGAAAALTAALVTLLLTYSRGGVLTLVVTVALVLWLVPGRRRMLAALAGGAAGAALPAWHGLTAPGLTTDGLAVAARRDAGIGLGWRLLVGLAVAALLAPLILRALRRVPVPAMRRTARTALVGGLVALVVVVGIAGSAAGGTDAVANDPGRLTSLESNNRLDWWSEALRGYEDAPVLGNGAGSFPLVHLRERDQGEDRLRVRQPHQLALQALVELGPLGVLLLGAAVGGIAWAAVRARRRAADPTVGLPIAVAAAFLVQSQLDWSWSIPALAAAAAGAGGVVIAAAAPGARERPALPRWALPVLAGAVLVMVASTLLPWWSQEQVNAGNQAIAAGRPAAAEARADEARALNPLSVQPLILRAQAAALRGDPVAVVSAAREATEVQPDNPATWKLLARLLGTATPEAVRAWRRVLELSPRDQSARQALGLPPG